MVLVADSVEDLQGLIDVVDRFCRKWRMDINLSKSEVMVVGKRDTCALCTRSGGVRACSICSPWVCRDVTLKTVKKYKYLGVWFTHDLFWTEHLEATRVKVSKATTKMGRVLNNNRLPARAKALIWLSSVRPKTEYWGEAWKANCVQEARLESLQVQAGTRIFKLNRKTKAEAVRALLQVPTLRRRRDAARIKYLVNIMTMDQGRLVRTVVNMQECKALRGQAQNRHWKHRMTEFVQTDEDVKKAYASMERSADRNQGVLPRDLDPTVDDFDYYPVKSWHKFLR